MLKTAEAVSIGHPDKIADYISCFILDKLIKKYPYIRYAVEVMIKGNTVVLGGELSHKPDLKILNEYVKEAIREIGYDEQYFKIWGQKAININAIRVIDLIGKQSSEIAQGITQNGWGDQGVFAGYACQGKGLINKELFLAKQLNNCLYEYALQSKNLGLDIKTQITTDNRGKIKTVIVAIPMIKKEDITDKIISALGGRGYEIIVNGTGIYQQHASIADCGVTGRKLACDFYSTACPIGGGSPWTKDPSKADLTLNLYARKLAIDNLKDFDECFVYLSSCIGRSQLPSCTIRQIKSGKSITVSKPCDLKPDKIISILNLRRPIYTHLCRVGITNINLF